MQRIGGASSTFATDKYIFLEVCKSIKKYVTFYGIKYAGWKGRTNMLRRMDIEDQMLKYFKHKSQLHSGNIARNVLGWHLDWYSCYRQFFG